ncbi:hypothetical protein GCM10010149_88390 [Nonomuraea roseoviolacea subsp. roseoviolacea]|uniref:hypothetical protein n=1 Tax=Nonomuraea roseoviolacea TaxID=103837 RepID=UPI0031DF659A
MTENTTLKDWSREPASADNPLTPVPMGTGSLVYHDTFSGDVPCKILRVFEELDGIGITRVMVRAEVTSRLGAYFKGEIITREWDRFYPRQSRVLRNGRSQIRMNYHPVITS